MLRTFAALGLLLLAPACSSLSTDAPPVADSTMVALLVDLYLADALQAIDTDAKPYARDSILARYQLSPSRYQRISAYYAEHPDAYLAVYTKAMDRLREERTAYGNVDAKRFLRTPYDSLAGR